jgi:hypothetical protein
MPKVLSIEPKHLSGKGGIGKGSARRHGADEAAWKRAPWPPESPNLRSKESDGTVPTTDSR